MTALERLTGDDERRFRQAGIPLDGVTRRPDAAAAKFQREMMLCPECDRSKLIPKTVAVGADGGVRLLYECRRHGYWAMDAGSDDVRRTTRKVEADQARERRYLSDDPRSRPHVNGDGTPRRAWRSAADADAASIAAIRGTSDRAPGVYRCPTCHSWHLRRYDT